MAQYGRRRLFFRLSIAAAFAGAAYVITLPPNASDRLIGARTHDFGAHLPGETHQHTFALRNWSIHTLHVVDVKTSCPCTVPELENRSVGFADWLHIPVTYTPTEERGKHFAEIWVEFSNRKPLLLSVVLVITAGYPGVVDFGSVLQSDGAQMTFPVYSVIGEPILVESCQFDEARFQVDWEPGNIPSNRVNVSVHMRADAPYGMFESKLNVTTTDPIQNEKTVTLKGHVLEPAIAEPNSIDLGVVGSGTTGRAEFTIRSPYGRNLSYVDCDRHDAHNLRVTVRNSEDSASLLIEVSADDLPESDSELFTAHIDFVVTDGLQEIFVPLTVHARPPLEVRN